jgi:hypothetical protein
MRLEDKSSRFRDVVKNSVAFFADDTEHAKFVHLLDTHGAASKLGQKVSEDGIGSLPITHYLC